MSKNKITIKNIYRLVSEQTSVCKIINNVKYQTTSSMPKIITQQTCEKRFEQTPKVMQCQR